MEHGVTSVHVFRAGVDLSRFHDTTPPPLREFVLLAGSAPWTSGQFRTKGFDLILDLVQKKSNLRLVLLWRGWLTREIRERVKARGLEDRVEILTEHADVDQVMSRVHAAIVLSDTQRRVKAYPHSLIEALACGRPVLVSRCIAMAEYVEKQSCGAVVETLTTADLDAAIEHLQADYEGSRARAARVGPRDFSLDELVRSYSSLYRDLVSPVR
jgi:glycosyltransferase involved in cell wall biosynthesis